MPYVSAFQGIEQESEAFVTNLDLCVTAPNGDGFVPKHLARPNCPVAMSSDSNIEANATEVHRLLQLYYTVLSPHDENGRESPSPAGASSENGIT